MRVRKILPCCAAIALIAAAQNAQRPEMTARELFYNAGPPAEQAKAQPKALPKRAPAKKAPSPSEMQQAESHPPTPAQPAQPSQTPHPTAQIIAATDTVPMRATAPPPETGTALGLKYTILKLTGNKMTPVAPSSVFHTGDKIQFSIETNGPGYLYIVNHGSSGNWMPMFPSPEIAGGSNYVEGFHTYTFPADYRFAFDEQAGDERVFLIFSRDAKPDFEQLVYSLQGGKTTPTNQGRPAQPSAPVLRASVDDSAIGRLNQTYARDLVIEKIGDDAKAKADPQEEKAVYVVNPSGSADSALVVDLHLVHQ